uniref:Uncharacterized protein n=1 Tax=Arundo donax TaxID=35708 RepID=A0A0A9CGF6_ARUDO
MKQITRSYLFLQNHHLHYWHNLPCSMVTALYQRCVRPCGMHSTCSIVIGLYIQNNTNLILTSGEKYITMFRGSRIV